MFKFNLNALEYNPLINNDKIQIIATDASRSIRGCFCGAYYFNTDICSVFEVPNITNKMYYYELMAITKIFGRFRNQLLGKKIYIYTDYKQIMVMFKLIDEKKEVFAMSDDQLYIYKILIELALEFEFIVIWQPSHTEDNLPLTERSHQAWLNSIADIVCCEFDPNGSFFQIIKLKSCKKDRNINLSQIQHHV